MESNITVVQERPKLQAWRR